MSDRTINEQLREEAERQGMVEAGDGGIEGEADPAAARPLVRQPLTPLMLATTTALDLLGVLVLLRVNVAAGVAVLAASGIAFALWLNLRLLALRRSVMTEQERERASR